MLLTSFLRILLTRSFRPFIFKGRRQGQVFDAQSLPPALPVPDFSSEKEFGLYVHIPFCRSLCPFCPYCKEVYDADRARRYKQALLAEIALVGRMNMDSNGGRRKQVTSLYFGGGSPALMAGDLGDIISALRTYYDIQDGIGVELHPSDVNTALLAVLKNAGVTMISIGIQSFHDDCLRVLGRNPADVDAAAIFAAIREADFSVVDTDLIFAIPGQNDEILLDDIEKAFSLGATQISTYPFIDFTFATNRQKPLDEKAKKKMLSSIATYCEETGRDRTSVWTFAARGTGKYSSVTRDTFIGFGVSATTLLHEQFRINTFSVDRYISCLETGMLPTSLMLEFTLRQRAVYYLFWSAYGMTIDAERFESFFGIPLKKLYGFEICIGKRAGLISEILPESTDPVHVSLPKYRLTTKGAYYYHFIEQQYTTAYIDRMWNVSRLTPFPQKIILR